MTSRCLFCDGELEITQLQCRGCETRIDSELSIPTFFRLPNDLQLFVLVFLRCRGNIREVEKELGISYPTVCKRLDLVNELLGGGPPAAPSEGESRVEAVAAAGSEAPLPVVLEAGDRKAVLEQVEQGTLSAKEAAELLRKFKK